MLLHHLHSSHLGPMHPTTGPLAHHIVSLVFHPLLLSHLGLLEQQVRVSPELSKSPMVLLHYSFFEK